MRGLKKIDILGEVYCFIEIVLVRSSGFPISSEVNTGQSVVRLCGRCLPENTGLSGVVWCVIARWAQRRSVVTTDQTW